jgi:hypothetical protein
MTFKDLASIISKRKQYWSSPDYDPYEEERAKLMELNTQLREAFTQAYKKRRENWFATHPDHKYFEPTLEETYQDTEPEEWIWYFWEYMRQTPEQRYQDMKNMVNGFGHDGIDGGPDSRECKPGCRFYPAEGRIEAIEVLHYYKKYKGFEEALASWGAILE